MISLLIAAALAASAGQPASEPVTAATSIEADGSQTMSHEAMVEAPIAEVWKAISTAEGWKGWAVPVAWQQGDILETSYSADARPGDASTIRQHILVRVPERMMVFRTVKAPARFPDFETYAKVTSIFELEPVGPRRTRVRLTGAGYAASDAGRRLRTFFEGGNRSSLEALQRSFAAAAEPAPVSAGKALEPLAFLVGHCWRGRFAGGQEDVHCFELVYDGRHIRDRHRVGTGYAGETIYSWSPSARAVEYVYFNSDGGVSRGTMLAEGDRLDFGDEIYTGPDGKQMRISTYWRRVGDDAYETVSQAGNDPTGSRIVRYVREKAAN